MTIFSDYINLSIAHIYLYRRELISGGGGSRTGETQYLVVKTRKFGVNTTTCCVWNLTENRRVENRADSARTSAYKFGLSIYCGTIGWLCHAFYNQQELPVFLEKDRKPRNPGCLYDFRDPTEAFVVMLSQVNQRKASIFTFYRESKRSRYLQRTGVDPALTTAFTRSCPASRTLIISDRYLRTRRAA